MNETGDVLSASGGAILIVSVVAALRMGFDIPARLLPLMALVGGIAWGVGAALLGAFGGNPLAGVLSGLLTAASASGLQGWTQTYRSQAPPPAP